LRELIPPQFSQLLTFGSFKEAHPPSWFFSASSNSFKSVGPVDLTQSMEPSNLPQYRLKFFKYLIASFLSPWARFPFLIVTVEYIKASLSFKGQQK
jgi:hypothetical protein